MKEQFRALRTRLGLTQEAIAARYGIPEESWKKYELGKAMPGANVIAQLVTGGVDGNWLVTGEGQMLRSESELPGDRLVQAIARSTSDRNDLGYGAQTQPAPEHPDVVWVPLYDGVEVSAGNGSLVWDETPGSALAFQRQWIQSLRTEASALALMRVRGESMEPVLHAGDVVMIDRSQRQVQRDGMYVLRLDGAVLLKWLQVLPEGAVRVASENRERFPPFELSAAQASSAGFEVIGRVRWWAHRAS